MDGLVHMVSGSEQDLKLIRLKHPKGFSKEHPTTVVVVGCSGVSLFRSLNFLLVFLGRACDVDLGQARSRNTHALFLLSASMK